MAAAERTVKPGWILLLVVAVYAVVMTFVARDARMEVRELRLQAALASGDAAAGASGGLPVGAPPTDPSAAAGAGSTPDAGEDRAGIAREGWWFPVPGARLPSDDAHLPGAARSYRNGVSQGFDFYGDDAGVPIVLGTPVIAVTDATVTRIDAAYAEPDEQEWATLLGEVADGAEPAELDRLRGRQVWLEDDAGRTYRYAHLSSIESDLRIGQRVRRGEVIASAGNSGTDDGVQGGDGGVRVHFEIWEDGTFFGADLEPAAVRAEAAARFVGP